MYRVDSVDRMSLFATRDNNQEALGGGGPAGCGVTGGLPWRAPVTALIWALTAAVLYGTGAALQQRQAAAAPRQSAGRPRLLLLLVQRPWWLLGIAVELGGFAAHAVALRTGPLTIVQLLVASSLLFSVAMVRLWSGRRLGWTAWAAVLAVIAGIASFVALAPPAGGVPGVSGHAGLAAACLATCAVPIAAAGLAAAGRRRALLLAVAAGLADAGIAVVTMVFSHVVSGGLTGMADSWATYALMLGGPCSLLLTQTAYQAGRPMITLPVIAVVTPVASLAAGTLLLGESAHLGVLGGARGPGGASHVGRTRGAGPAGDSASRPGGWPRIFRYLAGLSGVRLTVGSGPGPAGGAPGGRRSPARGRLHSAARQQLATVSISVIGGLSVWTLPAGDAGRAAGRECGSGTLPDSLTVRRPPVTWTALFANGPEKVVILPLRSRVRGRFTQQCEASAVTTLESSACRVASGSDGQWAGGSAGASAPVRTVGRLAWRWLT